MERRDLGHRSRGAGTAGLDELPPRELRYDRADEVLEACFALWNGWDENAFVLDKKQGVLADPSKVHYANYQGRWIKTRGPLSIPRSPQGHPVIMQAGSSDRGREFAARWAEVIFTIQRGKDEMREFYNDIKTRMAGRGRRPEECAILPSVSWCWARPNSIARERADYLDSLIDPELNRAATSSNLGADITKLKEGVTLAALQGNQGMKGSEDVLKQHMKAQGLTFARSPRIAAASASWWARPRWWPIACRRSSSRARATASSSRRSIIPACSSSFAAASCPNCSAAACSARNIPAGHCGRI